MSLVPLAIRLATVYALRGATLASDRVHDSDIDPIDETIHDDAAPIITVSTEDEQGPVDGRDLLNADRTIELVLELALARRVTVTIDGEQSEIAEIPHTDASLELALNLMARQITRALLAGNAWSALWRLFVIDVVEMSSLRGASADKGVRMAARQLRFKVRAIFEPPFGDIIEGGPWDKLLTLMRATPGLADIAKVVEHEITTPSLDKWRSLMADLGLREGGEAAIGFGQLLPDPPQPVAGVDVVGHGGTMSIDAGTIEEALGPEPQD